MSSQQMMPPKGVSKRMLVVIALMLLVILVPAGLVGLPTSKIVLTITNMEDMRTDHVGVTISGVDYWSLNLDPGESSEIVRALPMGTYYVFVRYWYGFYGNQSYYYEYLLDYACSLSMFETEEIEVELQDPRE